MKSPFAVRVAFGYLLDDEVLRVAHAVAYSAIYAREQLAQAQAKGDTNLTDLEAESEAWLALDKRLSGYENIT